MKNKLLILIGISVLLFFCKKQKLDEVPQMQVPAIVKSKNVSLANTQGTKLVDMSQFSVNKISDYKGKTKVNAANLKVTAPHAVTVTYTPDFHTIFFTFAADVSDTNPELTPDYGKWAICSGTKCVEANTGLWMEELVLTDDMAGPVTLNVYACLLPERRLTDAECGSSQSIHLNWTKVTNKQLFQIQQNIFQNEQDRMNLVLSLVDVATSYLNALPSTGDPTDTNNTYVTMAQNLVADPYLFAGMVSSPASEIFLSAMKQLAQKTTNASSGLQLEDNCSCTSYAADGTTCVTRTCKTDSSERDMALGFVILGPPLLIAGGYGVIKYSYKYYSNHRSQQALKNIMSQAPGKNLMGTVLNSVPNAEYHQRNMTIIGTILGGFPGGTYAGYRIGAATNQIVRFDVQDAPPQGTSNPFEAKSVVVEAYPQSQSYVSKLKSYIVEGDFEVAHGVTGISADVLHANLEGHNYGWTALGFGAMEGLGATFTGVGAKKLELSDDPFTAISQTFRQQYDAANQAFLTLYNAARDLYAQRNDLILSINQALPSTTPSN